MNRELRWNRQAAAGFDRLPEQIRDRVRAVFLYFPRQLCFIISPTKTGVPRAAPALPAGVKGRRILTGELGRYEL